jgi:hypothetical protein
MGCLVLGWLLFAVIFTAGFCFMFKGAGNEN